MKTILFTCLLAFAANAFGQKVDYTQPEGYEGMITDDQYRLLVDHSMKIVTERYEIASVKDAVIELEIDQDLATLNLHNLIIYLQGEDESDYEAAIIEHFQNIFASIDFQKNMDPYNYELMEDYLAIRIYEESYIMEHGGLESVIYRTDLEGTYSVLMLDLPGAFSPVQPELFRIWEVSEEESFLQAQDNVNRQACMKSSVPVGEDSLEIQVFFIENENYAASYALDLVNNTPEFLGEWGSVVAMPNKGVVVLCKVGPEEPVGFVNFIQQFKSTVEQFYREHAQPVSPHFFWYYQDNFELINVTEEDGIVNVVAPFRMMEFMTE